MFKEHEKKILNIVEKCNYSLKGIRTFEGRNGQGLNANLYKGKKKFCFILDEGNGGEINFSWHDKTEKPIFYNNIKHLGSYSHRGFEMNIDAEAFINFWVDLLKAIKLEKSLIKKRIVFIEKNSPDKYQTYKFRNNTKEEFIEILTFIKKVHKNNILEIINLRYSNPFGITDINGT